MARLAVTFTVICFLFAFSHARTPLDLPEHDIVSRDPTITLPESDTKTTILLPSEKPDTEPNTVFEIETQDREWKTASTEPIRESRESETESADESGLNQPFTVVTFRPTNRHFPHIRGDRQSPFFRRPYPCKHHHHRHHFGGEGPRFNGEGQRLNGEEPRFNGGRREVSYGNDMILSGEEDTNAEPMFRGDGERKIPARWVRFHHHGRPLFPFKHERFDMDDMKRPSHDHHHDDDDHHHDDDDHHHDDDDHHHHDDEDHHHHHDDHHHHHHHHMEEDEESERNHEEGGGLMKLVRKFLNHY